MRGKRMIKTVCEINISEIDFVSYTCKRCEGVVKFKKFDNSLKSCPICGLPFNDDQIKAFESLGDTLYHLRNLKNPSNISFVSEKK